MEVKWELIKEDSKGLLIPIDFFKSESEMERFISDCHSIYEGVKLFSVKYENNVAVEGGRVMN